MSLLANRRISNLTYPLGFQPPNFTRAQLAPTRLPLSHSPKVEVTSQEFHTVTDGFINECQGM